MRLTLTSEQLVAVLAPVDSPYGDKYKSINLDAKLKELFRRVPTVVGFILHIYADSLRHLKGRWATLLTVDRLGANIRSFF